MDYNKDSVEEASPLKEERKSVYVPARIQTIGTVASVTHGSRDVEDDDGSGYQHTKSN